MYLTLFYFFSVLAFASCCICAFSNNKSAKNSAFIIFLLTLSGIFALINSGYIAFIFLILSGGYYSYKSIKNILLSSDNNNGIYNLVRITQILIISLTGALIASILGSTMWQGTVYFYKEITIANFAETISGEYFIFFLVIIISSFLILLNFKRESAE